MIHTPLETEGQEIAALDEVLDLLRGAERGSTKFDYMIAYCLGIAVNDRSSVTRVILDEVVSDEAYSQDVLSELLEGAVPAHTTSLDAKIAGETIVLSLYSAKRGLWAAVQRAPDGREYLVWAADEILARRLAALRGWKAARLSGTIGGGAERSSEGRPPPEPRRPASTAGDAEIAEQGEEWAILF